MGMMGIRHEAFIPEIDSFAGVATFMAAARESKVILFI
jgi:peroxiredoxin family protein